MTNILIDQLPEAVMLENKVYPVDWGYRAMILIEICMFDNRWNEERAHAECAEYFLSRKHSIEFGRSAKRI